MKNLRTILFNALIAVAAAAHAQPAPLAALPTLDITSYMGTWYQVAPTASRSSASRIPAPSTVARQRVWK